MRGVLTLSLVGVLFGAGSGSAQARTTRTVVLRHRAETPDRLRFVALGDAGRAGDNLDAVIAAARAACEERCDFAVLLGDNIYPRGIASPADPQWNDIIERPLAVLGLPVYAALGNHDYGAPRELFFLGGIGLDPRRRDAALARARTSDRVAMPAPVYKLVAGPAELVFFDTQPSYLSDGPWAAWLGVDDDANDIDRALAMHELQEERRWRIALAHHPYRSNGVHGDAGSYDAAVIATAPLPGVDVKRLLERRVLGRFSLFLAGHDHNVMDLGDERGTALIVSGAGSEHRPLASDRPVPFAAASLGFALVDVTERQMTISLITVDDPGASPATAKATTSATAPTWRVAHRRTLQPPP
jgi:hypothetical protein